MLTSTQSSFPSNGYAFIERNGQHYMVNNISFRVNEDESLTIEQIDVPNISENNEYNIIFHSIFQNNPAQDEEPYTSFDYSKVNHKEKFENPSNEEQKFNNSSNDELPSPLNKKLNFESNYLNEPKKDKKSSSNKVKKDKKNKFSVIYPTKNDYDFNFNKITKKNLFLIEKRIFRKDNMLKKIKCTFLNNYLFNKINKFLKVGKKPHKNFYKFSQKLISDMTKKNNKKLLDMTLRQIIQDDLNERNKSNLLILSSSKEEKNHKLEELLNTKYKDLFEIYINSKEFENEIQRLKEKDKTDFYIKNYRYLSYNFVIFFEGNNEI